VRSLCACGRTLRLEGFSPSFERLAGTLLDPAADEPAITLTHEGAWEPVGACSYWPEVHPSPDPDWPFEAASRLWHCRFHPARGLFRFGLRPLRTEPTPKRVSHLLRFVVQIDATLRGGRFLHAAALVRAGVAGLFVGPSGIGKTTLARKVPAAGRLADDATVIIPDDGPRLVAWRSPFAGREGLPAGAREVPVAAVFLLHQAREQALARVSPSEAFAALVPHVTPLRAPWAPGNPLEPLAGLVERVPVFRLGATLDTDPLVVLEAALA
jgi:hypothetical protein